MYFLAANVTLAPLLLRKHSTPPLAPGPSPFPRRTAACWATPPWLRWSAPPSPSSPSGPPPRAAPLPPSFDGTRLKEENADARERPQDDGRSEGATITHRNEEGIFRKPH
eukprot:scaffold85831_cov33-Tisochrysis_lutea.AAC.1